MHLGKHPVFDGPVQTRSTRAVQHTAAAGESTQRGISVLWPLQCWLTKYKDTRMGDMLLMAQCVPYSAAATGPNGH